jgi:hypothetical protein
MNKRFAIIQTDYALNESLCDEVDSPTKTFCRIRKNSTMRKLH